MDKVDKKINHEKINQIKRVIEANGKRAEVKFLFVTLILFT